MFPFNLRDYQKKAISEVYQLIKNNNRRILIFAPTGGGKTIISSKIVYDAANRGKRILFVVHRDVLIEQTYQKFAKANLECGFYKAGRKENSNALVQIASVQTLSNRQDWKHINFDLIIFDECHIVAFNKICLEMLNLLFPNSIYLGLTATPWRLSSRESLGDIYTELVATPTPKELILQGFLVKPSYYALTYDVSLLENIKLNNGDYNQQQLSIVCDRPELIDQLCSSWFDLAYKRPTIVFSINVQHAMNIAKAFCDRGIPAAIVSGKTSVNKRNELYNQLHKGELSIIASCGALSEGFDAPEINCVILARPTKSKALYFQQVGRGLRLFPEKHDCLILDQSGNVSAHGFIEDLEEITLCPSIKNKNQEKRPPPLKICPAYNGGCGKYIYSIYICCPYCKYNFDLQKLVNITGESRLILNQDEEKLHYYRNLLRDSYDKQFAPTWAAIKFKENHGFYPPFDWGRGAIFFHHRDQYTYKKYKSYLIKTAQRLQKDDKWIEKYLYLEFGNYNVQGD